MRNLGAVLAVCLLANTLPKAVHSQEIKPKQKPTLTAQLQNTAGIYSHALSADSKWLAISTLTDTLLWHVPSGIIIRSFQGANAAISANGKWLVTTREKKALLWDARTGRQFRTFEEHAWMPNRDVLLDRADADHFLKCTQFSRKGCLYALPSLTLSPSASASCRSSCSIDGRITPSMRVKRAGDNACIAAPPGLSWNHVLARFPIL